MYDTGNHWLTVPEAAELTGYHPEHLRDLLRQGIIEGKKFGAVWMVDRKSLLSYTKEAGESGDSRRGPH